MTREDAIRLLEHKKNPKNGMYYLDYSGALITDFEENCEMVLTLNGKEIKRLKYVVKVEDDEQW